MKRSKRAIVLMLAGLLTLILTFTLIFYAYFRRINRNLLEEDQLSLVSGATETAETLLMNIRQNAYYLCCNEDLADILVNSQDGVPSRLIETLSVVFSLNTGTPTAPLMQNAYPMLLLDGQFPLSASAERFSISRSMITRYIYSSAGVENEDWYQRTLALRGQIYAFCDEGNRDYAFFSHLLRSTCVADPRYSEQIGVVVYAMPMLRLNQLLASSRLNDESCVVLLYEDKVIACTDEALFSAGQSVGGVLELPEAGRVGETSLDQVRYSVTQARFQKDWQCVLLVPERSIVYEKAPSYMLALMLFLLAAVLLLFSFIIFRREREEQKKLRASELKMMQAQINPHFVYNTLDSISCIALMEGNEQIVTMVASLINILKYSINFSRTTVPLREEINYLEDYICIQQIRFSGGFRFEYEIPERYMDVRVSPIILQPLVENALFHAASQNGELRIRIFCEEKGNCLLIHVADNGSSGDAEKINGFLKEDDAAGGHGIGIRNVYRRVALLSGGRGGLRYAQLPDGGLDAIVSIPLDAAPPEALA